MESLSNSILALDGLGKKTWQLHSAVPLNSRHCACLFVNHPPPPPPAENAPKDDAWGTQPN